MIKTKAEIYNKQGRYDVALRLIDSSRMMCPDTSDLTARALWAFHASEAYEGLGQAKKSLEALKYYCILRDSLEDDIHWPAVRSCCSGHGWGCAYGTGQNCGRSSSKSAS